jgi:hypothetical protein
MSYRITVVENVVYSTWKGFTAEELQEMAVRVAEVRRALGRPVVYVARIPAGGRSFTPEEHVILQDYLRTILPHCASIHHVVEGDGFVKSARLAGVNNFARGTTRARDFVIHETLEEAFAVIRSSYGVDLRERVTGRPPEGERASSAFRAAARIIEGKKRRE